MQNKSFFSSWTYIVLALVVYYGVFRIVFSFQSIDPATVVLQGELCAVAQEKPDAQGYCTATGRLTSSLTGDRFFSPRDQLGVQIPLGKELGFSYQRGAEHFPGGSLGMLIALILPWVLLFAPTGVALVRQASSLIDRYHRLFGKR
ncbi:MULTISPECIES: hypothetical protein [Caballeronia]|uniref:hypothetical protein n=1 Tax=Caballeronia TaxID=1827195 RepID=UPI001FD3C13B|nr:MULTISPECIES: hypothetical protein [Caballeronia]MDR5798998.1 hypothetical protein [Caballeronia sp. LZ001]